MVDRLCLGHHQFWRWESELWTVYDTRRSQAILEGHEPELVVQVQTIDHIGYLRVRVEIASRSGLQEHRFDFDAGSSYLPAVIHQCQALLSAYPVRNPGRCGLGYIPSVA
jgi:hypothetical protein